MNKINFKKLGDIAKAYSKLLSEKAGYISVEDEELKEKRMKVCNECIFMNKKYDTCKECGCYLPAKTLMSNQTCPKEFW